ncbi:MAG: NAD-dependent epimerase/dehydratase family protein [Granulosicoccus sp.]
MGLNWLVSGGCGFIGRNLVSALLEADASANIRIYDNLSVGSSQELDAICDYQLVKAADVVKAPVGVELVIADILDGDSFKSAATGIDVVVHLAANTGVGPSVENPLLDCHANVNGIVNALEAARHHQISKFVFASSGAPVGEVMPPIHEEIVPHPVSPYGASKLAGEGYCSAYFHCFGIDTVALRFGNVYGPLSGKKESVVAKFINRTMKGEILEIYGDGTQTRDFIYVKDLVNAIEKAATVDGIGGNVFQIATSRETTLLELAEALTSVLRSNGLDVPDVVHAEKRVGDVQRNFSDTTKAKDILGWQATTDLAEGLDATVRYFQDSINQAQ